MINSRKKGFTLVELVIVIAVIAILAAVLIPTFSSLVKKANLSADQQAVRQINTLLATEFATEKPETLKEWSSKKGEKADNTSTRKNAVLTWLKNDSTKHSAIAYELWNIGDTASEEEKGAARSLFSKKVRNAPNDNGSEYGFTKQEVNSLWRMMSRG